MLILEIKTSKSNLIWPSGYWKTLIDSIFKNGSINNPVSYLDLKQYLGDKVSFNSSRYYIELSRYSSNNDDSSLKAISIEKVTSGSEKLVLKQIDKIDPSKNNFSEIDFDYFATIGNKKYELQTRKNREKLNNSYKDTFLKNKDILYLSLFFKLQKNNRRDRDLDNLVDAIIPEFNKYFHGVKKIFVCKDIKNNLDRETLYFSLKSNF